MKPTMITGSKFYAYTCILRVYVQDLSLTIVHDTPLESLTRGHGQFDAWVRASASNKFLLEVRLYNHGRLLRLWTFREGEIDVSLLSDAYAEASTLPPWIKKEEKDILVKQELPFMILDVEFKPGDPRNQVNPGAKWLLTIQLIDPHKKLDAAHENPKKHPRTYAMSLDADKEEDGKRNLAFGRMSGKNMKGEGVGERHLPYGPVVLTKSKQYQIIKDYVVLPDEVKVSHPEEDGIEGLH